VDRLVRKGISTLQFFEGLFHLPPQNPQDPRSTGFLRSQFTCHESYPNHCGVWAVLSKILFVLNSS